MSCSFKLAAIEYHTIHFARWCVQYIGSVLAMRCLGNWLINYKLDHNNTFLITQSLFSQRRHDHFSAAKSLCLFIALLYYHSFIILSVHATYHGTSYTWDSDHDHYLILKADQQLQHGHSLQQNVVHFPCAHLILLHWLLCKITTVTALGGELSTMLLFPCHSCFR